jgi:hypothetical protein
LILVYGNIRGHRHPNTLNADLGDYYNFVRHMKEKAADDEIVFAFDSGDLTRV